MVDRPTSINIWGIYIGALLGEQANHTLLTQG